MNVGRMKSITKTRNGEKYKCGRERVEHWVLYNADCIMLFQLDEGNMQCATREFYPRREDSRDALMDANAGEKNMRMGFRERLLQLSRSCNGSHILMTVVRKSVKSSKIS